MAAMQFLFINGCLVGLMLIWDSLPKYVGGVLLFALPMAVGIALAMLLENRLAAFSDRTDAAMVIVITSILLWLPGIYPGIFVLKDYLQTALQQTVKNASVHSFREFHDAGFVSFGNGHIDPRYNATLVTSQNVKHGDTYTRVYLYYYVTPVLWPGWQPDMPVGVLAVRDSTTKIDEPFDPHALVQGLVVKDPYDVSHFRLALQRAETNHGLKIEKNPLLLVLSPYSFEDALRTKRLWALVAMGLVNLILIGPVVYYKIKALPPPEQKQELDEIPEEDIVPPPPPEIDPEEAERQAIWDLAEVASYDPDPEARHKAILELGRVMESSTNPDARTALARVIFIDTIWRNRIEALEILAKVNDDSTYSDILGPLLNDESPEVRMRAAELMGERGDPLSLRALKEAAKKDNDNRVREKALGILNKHEARNEMERK